MDAKSEQIYKRIKNYLQGINILDIGVGAGGIYCYLQNKGYTLTGVDVDNSAVFSNVKVELYDGLTLPYKDNSFDTALIIQVLHHCGDGLRVLSEAKRVAKRVIVVEDTYRNNFEKMIVSANDEFDNWEFYQHPYHTSIWWKDYLKKNGYKIIYYEEYSGLMYHVMYGRWVLFVVE